MRNIVETLFERNRMIPDKVVYQDDTGVITYSALEQQTRKIAAWMIQQGIVPGDRVSIVLYDRASTVAVIFATVLIGAVACMINPRGKPHNIKHQASFVDPRLIVTEHNIQDVPSITVSQLLDQANKLETWNHPSPTELDDVAFILWTSGTTGHGKAVMQTHRNYIETTQLVGIDTVGIQSTDRIYTTAKLFFAIGVYASMFWPQWAGAEVLLDTGLSIPSRVRNNIETYQPTVFYSVPVIYSQLATREIRCQAHCLAGGDQLPQSVIDRWKKYTGQLIYNTSGVTEGTCCYTYNRHGTTSAGQAVPGYALRVVDDAEQPLAPNQVGRLQIRTQYQARGYYKEPEWTAQMFGHEWMYTGDYAKITESGDLHYLGRVNDVIKINGQFVNPSELENTLQSYPGVEQAAVISRPGEDDIERIEAFVVPAVDTTLDTAQIRAWMLQQHERYAVPRIIHTVSQLPRTDTGKLQRFVLKKETA